MAWPGLSTLLSIRVLWYHWGLYRRSQTGCIELIHYAKTKLESLFFPPRILLSFDHPANMANWPSDSPFIDGNSKSLDVRPVYVFTAKLIYISMAAGKYESEGQQTTEVFLHRSLELHILIETLNFQVVSHTHTHTDCVDIHSMIMVNNCRYMLCPSKRRYFSLVYCNTYYPFTKQTSIMSHMSDNIIKTHKKHTLIACLVLSLYTWFFNYSNMLYQGHFNKPHGTNTLVKTLTY